jgi:hypothetical protein
MPAGSRIEASERMMEALELHVERDFHDRDYIRDPGAKPGKGRPVEVGER